MESLLELTSLVLSVQFMAIECQNDFNVTNIDDESLISSSQVKYMYEQNTLTEYLRSLKRFEHILGFICACSLIREANNMEFKYASHANPRCTCTETWTRWFQCGTNPMHLKLRGSGIVPGLLHPQEYKDCGSSLCTAYYVCSKHIQCDTDTVQVLNQVRAGTTKTIVQLLQEEGPKYLLTVENMKYINIFITAIGQHPFPYIRFNMFGNEYAIPKVRNASDKLICPAFFRNPLSVTRLP